MFDIHCHFLPGIDDGPQTMAESLLLAKMAVADGITHTIVTPHIHPGRYENDKASIDKIYRQFKDKLKEEKIALEVGMAAEVRISMEILPLIAEGKIPFIGELDGYKIMLLEFPHSHILPGTDKMVDYLLKRNIRPLIAHPERNKDVIRKFEKIEPFAKMGCLMQLTSGSIAGDFGEAAQERSHQILNAGWATVIATDSHDPKHRPPVLMKGQEAAAQLVGHEEAKNLVDTNPRSIAGSQFGLS